MSQNGRNGHASPAPDYNSLSLPYVEQLFEAYRADPASVSSEWQDFFKNTFSNQPELEQTLSQTGVLPGIRPGSVFNPPTAKELQRPSKRYIEVEDGVADAQNRLDQIIRNYRVRAHRIARFNPLQKQAPYMAELDPEYYGFTEADMDRVFSTTQLPGSKTRTLREVLGLLKNTYGRSIGVQYMHIDDLWVRQWLQNRLEGSQSSSHLDREQQIRILRRLTDAVIFEEFIQRKYIGAKSFSLEGAETLIPLLDLTIEKAGKQDLEEIVFGMAHRGRLNVLSNILGKSPAQIFHEFEDKDAQAQLGRGDVKYHLGYTSDYKTQAGKTIQLSLCFNPSHLEYVNPVALGRVRARQARRGDKHHDHSMAILIHGDAAFIGEGVVQETLNLSELRGYRTGGTLHIIVNNQIGFTTSPDEARSCPYATDIAKMLQIPIFHVDGEDPEAVAQTLEIAMDFRKQFKRDVVIDMYCYRRRGHNETDEPKYTHPKLYRQIDDRASVRATYMEKLLELGEVTRAEADDIVEQRKTRLESELTLAREGGLEKRKRGGLWAAYHGGPEDNAEEVDTGLSPDRLKEILDAICTMPEDFNVHPKLKRWLENRRKMIRGEAGIDWATAEALAFASLLLEGHPVRMTGQDCRRGTFSHRHMVLYDVESDVRERIVPHNRLPASLLANGVDAQAKIEIRNSPLSEAGVMGFEYGYSLDTPDSLVMWEAQFGDFVNCAQVIIDQFIISAEEKWGRLSGFTLLLPHGMEGQGPEHSSARLERFLNMAADDNMQVIYPSTPAQYYHMLRRQTLRKWRKPLIVMTPKSLLRNPECISSFEDLAEPHFKRVITDDAVKTGKNTKLAIFCTGKVYYDLVKERKERNRDDIVIHRVEQLYPFPRKQMLESLKGLPKSAQVLWVQEEPENMGACHFMRLNWGDTISDGRSGGWPFSWVSRPPSASPATGSNASHRLELKILMDGVFDQKWGSGKRR